MPLWTTPTRRSTSWSLPGGLASQAPAGVTVTTGGTPHTKTAWTQIISSTGSSEWLGFWLMHDLTSLSATDSSALLDIGVGTAGNEIPIVNNLPIGYITTTFGTNTAPTWIPLYIPASTRITVRYQSAIASAANKFTFIGNTSGHGLHSDNDLYGYCTTYGANTANSQGVSATSGSADNYGTPAEISAALTHPVHALLVGVQGAGSTNTLSTASRFQVMGGTAGAEVARTTDFYFSSSSSENITNIIGNIPYTQPCEGLSIPAGERMSIKAACHTATQTYDYTIIAFTR